MSVPFEIPDWVIDTSPPQPPDTSDVDPHRVEDLVNRFIAAKQEALFLAPGAYYRTTGGDAVDGAPGILDRLNGLKQATLDAANDDSTRFVLGPRLDAHLDDAGDGLTRHVAAQRDVFNRQTIAERQRLIQRAAQLEHDNDDKLAGLAEAHASTAQELARMNGEPEGAAMDAARSAIWRTAIDQRLANGNDPQAIDLFDQVKNQIAPDDHLSLDGPLQVARNDQAANQWIANQTGTDGPSLQDRAAVDPTLPPDTKLIVRAKLDAQDSTAESKRVATVKALDDQISDVTRTLATTPGAYKTGTLFQIARAYDDAGEPDKAVATLGLATQEAVLVPFAQASVDRQQRLIDSLPDGELRDAAITIQLQQAHASARNPFTGTKLNDEVVPPRSPASNEAAVESGQANTTQVADSRKEYCLERCSDQILMLPFSKRPGTFDQCMAHCEGRAYFHQIQPLIPFPGSGK